jgi:predicted dehydrogenase
MSKIIRVGIIGQGRSGRDIHGAHFKTDPRYKVVAICDAIAERRQRAEQEFACPTVATVGELLARRDMDIVVNASFSNDHVPTTLAALAAGHNVLCDKPLARSPKDVDKLIAAAAKAKKLLAIFQQSRFAAAFQQALKVVRSGVLGRIVQVNMAAAGFARRWDWQTLQERNGGNLMNTGPHPLDQALRFWDSEEMPEVFCHMDRANVSGDAEDHVLLILRGPGRPLIHVEVSSCCAYPPCGINIYGTRGGLKGSSTELAWKYFKPSEAPKQKLIRTPLFTEARTPAYCGEKLTWHEETWTLPEEKKDQFAWLSRQFYDMLYKTLTRGRPLEITPQQVRQQIAVIEAARKQNPRIYGK